MHQLYRPMASLHQHASIFYCLTQTYYFRLQKFKLNIANTIVNQENSGLTSMATDQLLNLFSIEGKSDNPQGSQSVLYKSPSKGLKSMLQDMTELWNESEYDSEYNVNNFLCSLAK